MQIPTELLHALQQNSSRDPSPAVSLLVEEILDRYGDAVRAILFYGSCLHKGEDLDGLFDLYVLVDTYDSVNKKSMLATLNKLLPPNVFYLEVPYNEQTVRAKYAILSLSDLQKGTSRNWFHSYLWARFCQPTVMVYVCDEKIKNQVNIAFAQAVITFVTRVLPRLQPRFTIRELWQKGLELSYKAEFRPERPDQQVRLYDATPDYFKDITCMALSRSPYQVTIDIEEKTTMCHAEMPARTRLLSRMTWAIRIIQGKALSVLRLVKGTLTFEGGVDYILWKIKRHSGVSMEASPFLRRHPLLAMCVLSWRLYRRGGVQ
ncbi:MAG: hypothetical protein U9R66_08825 [Thermodesulfobacteriota bacterium]|nr:hypothetical protein [Thermodesulfobacteriota bacterium]